MELSFKEYQLTLKYPFLVSGAEARETWDVVYVQLKSGEVIGYGEAAPSRFWGESVEGVKEAATQVDLSRHDTPLVYELILREVRENVNPPRAFLAALDMALFDAIGKKMQIPVRRFLGLPEKHNLPTSHTIGIADLDVISRKIAEARDYPILKVKLGSDYDIELIEHIRKLTDKPIRVDANGGWSREEALEKITWLQSQNVEFVEQPLPPGQLEDTAWIRERVQMPIFADEDVRDSADIPKVAEFYDGINIKLMKCGGILEAVRMIRLAREKGLKVMLGCMIESTLAIAAAAQLLPLADYADLDGHLLISNDPFEGLKMESGVIRLSGKPGLGVWPKKDLFPAE